MLQCIVKWTYLASHALHKSGSHSFPAARQGQYCSDSLVHAFDLAVFDVDLDLEFFFGG
jgi:hypothetical protein